MLDRLDADAISLSFGGLENTVLLPDFAVIGILHFDQKQPPGMQICSDFAEFVRKREETGLFRKFTNFLKTVLTKQKRKIILRHINNIHKFTKPVRKSSKP